MAGAEPVADGYPARSVAVQAVTSLLTRVGAEVPGAFLLHRGASAGADRWEGDIDLLVTGARDRFLDALHAAAAALGFVVVLEVQRIFTTLEIETLYAGSASWTVVLVDRHGAVLHVDVTFAAGAEIEPDRAPKIFGIPEVGADGLHYLILKRIRKLDRTEGSWASILERRQDFTLNLRPYLGATAREIEDALNHGSPPPLEALRRARAHLVRRRISSPAIALAGAQAAKALARRGYRPAGVFICLAGVDGSGKSAIADALVAWSPFRRVRRLHARPGVLKPPGWFVGRQPQTGSDPHGAEPWGPTMSTLRLLYFWADFWIGHWMRIWPVTARGGLVVSERWWWDMYVDPRRHRLRPMPALARRLGRAVPQADVFIVLSAPSACILQRKQELTASEIERQQKVWVELLPAMRSSRAVDASASLPAVTTEVVQAVAEMQGRRIRPASAPRGSQIVAVPPRNPRWLIDPEDAATVRAAMRLYRPSRREGLALARGADLLASRVPSATRILRRLGSKPAPEAMRAVEWACEAVAAISPGRRPRVAAFLGSEGPARKLSAVFLDDRGMPELFAKVGFSVAAVAALEHEALMLQGLASTIRGARVPAVVSFERSVRGALLLLTPVVGARYDNDAAPSGRHIRFIAEMLTHQSAFDGSAHVQGLHAQMANCPDTHDAVFLSGALTATSSIWCAVTSAHFSHGDFTPWNCLDCGDTLGVVDWEMAGQRIAGWDAVHYVSQVESIAHSAPVAEAAEQILHMPFLARVGDTVAAACDIDLPSDERWPALQLLCLIEGAVKLLATQPEVSRRGIAVRTHAVARILGLPPPRDEP